MRIAITQLADGVALITPRPTHRTPAGPDGVAALAAESIRGWSDVTDELLRLRRLDDDWDGQGAEAPTPEAVDAALKLAVELRAAGMPPADRAVAGVNGTIFFEWHDPKQYLEIEVITPGHTEGRRVFTDTNVVEEFTLTR